MPEKKTSLTKEESEILNDILPKKFHQEVFDSTHFTYNLNKQVRQYLHESEFEKIKNLERDLDKKSEAREALLNSLEVERCSLLNIFNVDHRDAQLLGMVDVGTVKTFTSASSGNKLEGGLMQLAIESTFENVWKTNNAQMKGLNEVKLEFLSSCLKKYPDCDSILNYQVDFRELGSSGNVFIYMRGTASILGNEKLKSFADVCDSKMASLELKYLKEIPNQINELNEEIKKYRRTIYDVPSNFKQALKYVQLKTNT